LCTTAGSHGHNAHPTQIPELADKAWDAADDTGKENVQDLVRRCLSWLRL
jgi:hypothetical protein